MPIVLLVTVGSSPQPIMTAVQRLKPDRIIFLCSDGSKGSKFQVVGGGLPCTIWERGNERKLPKLVTLLKLEDRFDAGRDLIVIKNPVIFH